MARQVLVYDILTGKNTLIGDLDRSKKKSSGLNSSIVKLGKSFGGVALKAAGVAGALGSAAAAFVTVKSVKEAIALENALIGLRTVAAGTGNDIDKVAKAARDLSADGLIPLTDASASLKNLLASGLDADEAIKTFKVLRDSAAFGRQGSLDLGEAIRGASEGIKNGNSILVDNAGITKNLSVLQKEYAASIGTTVGQLTEAQKVQAIYTGLQREGALFTGDYARLNQTFSGALSSVTGQFKFLTADIGNFITQSPVAIQLVKSISGVFSGFSEFLKNNEGEIQSFVNNLIKGFVSALPVVVGFFQGAANAGSFFIGTVLRAQFIVNGLAQEFADLEFVQTIFAGISKGVATVADGLLQLLSLISGTTAGSSFIENVLGLNAQELQGKLDRAQEAVVNFADNVTGEEISDKLKERGNVLDQLIGANESGIAKLDENFEIVKEKLRANADEINAITEERVKKTAVTQKKARDKNIKEEGEDYSFRKALFGDFKSFEESTNKERGQNFKSTLGTISTLTQQSNSTLFGIGKAAAISTATIDGIAATQKALASAPPPFNFALAALVGVASAANIAKIASAKPPAKRQDGGFIPGATSSGDQVPVLANGRELFLNRAQQAELFNIARGQDQASTRSGNQVIDVRLELEGTQLARVIRTLTTDGFLPA